MAVSRQTQISSTSFTAAVTTIILPCVPTAGVIPPYVLPRYLRQVQDEVLRVSTLAPYAARFSDEEVVVGGYTLPPKVRH